jgi:hypothetical protein
MRPRTWLLAPAALACSSSPAQSAAVCAKDYPALKDREALVALNPEFGDSEFGDSALISRPT